MIDTSDQLVKGNVSSPCRKLPSSESGDVLLMLCVMGKVILATTSAFLLMNHVRPGMLVDVVLPASEPG